jgi:two-component system LytT family response regulator
LDAFDVQAVDYILKPIDDERIVRAVQRAVKRLNATDHSVNKPPILEAIHAINRKESHQTGLTANSSVRQLPGVVERKVVIKDRDEITILKQSDIEWVDAAGDYVCLHAQGETHINAAPSKNYWMN